MKMIKNFLFLLALQMSCTSALWSEPSIDFQSEMEKFPALRDLSAETFYSDHNASVIDDAKMENYRKAVAPLDAFVIRLAEASNAYSLKQSKKEGYLVLALLHTWAKEEALLGHFESFQAKASRVWYAFALSANYAQVRPLCLSAPAPVKCRKIERWLDQIHLANINALGRIQKNNILYWIAAGAKMTGKITNNIMLSHWGQSRLRRGWREISKNGTLALEIKRGKRAAFYHAFALTALTWGTAVDGPGALDRILKEIPNSRELLRRVSESARRDFQTFDQLTRTSQEVVDYPYWLLPWLAVQSDLDLPDPCHLKAGRFHKVFAGQPQALLKVLWQQENEGLRCDEKK